MSESSRPAPLFNLYRSPTGRVHWPNAYLLCLASRLAYFPKEEEGISEQKVLKTLSSWGLGDALLISKEDEKRQLDTQLFIATNRNTVFVVFRGTEPDNLTDFVTDAKVRQKKNPAYKGKVHRGFIQALQLVWPQLIKEIRTRVNAGGRMRKVCLAGHSLGAALATLATQRLHRMRDIEVDALYTYGCPRAGNLDFKRGFQAIKKRLFRFENNNDAVPKLPPDILFFYDYTHVSEPLYFYGDGTYERNPSVGERHKDLVLSRLKGLLTPGVDGIQDHGLDQYSKLMKAQMSPGATKRRMLPPWQKFWG